MRKKKRKRKGGRGGGVAAGFVLLCGVGLVCVFDDRVHRLK